MKGVNYTHIDSTDFIQDVDPDERNFVLVDEVGEISRGYYQFSFAQLMAQSRKSIGEDQVFIMTAQVSQQTSATMRGMVDYIIYPEIMARHKKDKKPVFVKAHFYRKIPRMVRPTFEKEGYQMRRVYEACDFYDTFHEVSQMSDGKFKKFLKVYGEYVDSKGKIRELTTRLHKDEGLNKSDADMMARQIVNARLWGALD